MGFSLGWLLGGSKSADKAIDGAISGIDKLFYTAEEKADTTHKGNKLKFELVESILKSENNERSKARRAIAKAFTQTFLVLILGSAVLYCFGLEDKAKYLLKLAQEISVYVGGIVGFYFLYYGAQGVISKYKDKGKE